MLRSLILLVFVFLAACQTPSPDAPPTPVATSTPKPSATPKFTPTLAATPEIERNSQSEAMRPNFADDVHLLPDATRYLIDVNIAFDPRREVGAIEGIARIQYTNPHSELLSDIVLMLWPNDIQYRAEASAGPALIDGQLVPAQSELGGLALRYELPEPLEPGATLDLSVPFSVLTEGPD